MGPTDLRLVRNCPCPVWLEAPDRDVRWRRILVAIDPQAEDDDLNNALLEMGASLSKASGGALHTLFVISVLLVLLVSATCSVRKFDTMVAYCQLRIGVVVSNNRTI